jgi:hypothetical protein
MIPVLRLFKGVFDMMGIFFDNWHYLGRVTIIFIMCIDWSDTI